MEYEVINNSIILNGKLAMKRQVLTLFLSKKEYSLRWLASFTNKNVPIFQATGRALSYHGGGGALD